MEVAINYYPFHIGDYAVHTRHLSLMEDLAYRRLLDLYYTRERAIPAGTQSVCRLLGMRDHAAEVDAVLTEFFTLNDAGEWVHARCDAEIAKVKAAADRSRTNGKAGGRPVGTKKEPTNNPVGSQQEPTANPVESYPRPKTQDPRPNTKEDPPTPKRGGATVHEFPPGFERFWTAYPKKVGKDAAAKAFARRKPDAAMVDAMVAAVEAQSGCEQWRKEGGQFIPNPATWLNQGRWQDEQGGCSDDAFAGAI